MVLIRVLYHYSIPTFPANLNGRYLKVVNPKKLHDFHLWSQLDKTQSRFYFGIALIMLFALFSLRTRFTTANIWSGLLWPQLVCFYAKREKKREYRIVIGFTHDLHCPQKVWDQAVWKGRYANSPLAARAVCQMMSLRHFFYSFWHLLREAKMTTLVPKNIDGHACSCAFFWRKVMPNHWIKRWIQ